MCGHHSFIVKASHLHLGDNREVLVCIDKLTGEVRELGNIESKPDELCQLDDYVEPKKEGQK